MDNPFAERLESLMRLAKRRRLDAVALFDEANVRALTGVACDNARLVVEPRADGGEPRVTFYTDFRYVPAVKRTAPDLKVADFKDFRRVTWKRIGFEGCMTASDYLDLKGAFPRAKLVDVLKDVHALRAVKTPAEIAAIAAAVPAAWPMSKIVPISRVEPSAMCVTDTCRPAMNRLARSFE